MSRNNYEESLVSESEYADQPLDEAIKESIRDLQTSLNNIEQGLLAIIDHDIITPEEYGPVWELSNDMIGLSKEMRSIVKSFKPKGFKLTIGMMTPAKAEAT